MSLIMVVTRSKESLCVQVLRVLRRQGLVAVLVAVSGSLAGCASFEREKWSFGAVWDPGVEVRFPGSISADNNGGPGGGDSSSKVVTAPDGLVPSIPQIGRGVAAVTLAAVDATGVTIIPRRLRGIPDYGDTKYTLIPGTYAFEYQKSGFNTAYGVVRAYPIFIHRGRDFIRHASIALTPGPSVRRSVLSEADLNRARQGDVVTKIVFMAHLPAVRDRLDDIETSLRDIDRVRVSLEEQHNYWIRRLRDRRLNTQYSSDFGWGVDTPGWDLALLQTLVGPERYHWHRFTEAEDKVRTYETKLADLDLPTRRLTEEKDALKRILNSVDVLHRTTDMLILTSDMIRPYHDPVDEVHRLRGTDVWADAYRGKIMHDANDWIGPWGKVHFPYWYSSLSMAGLAPGLRPVVAPRRALTKNIGEVLLVLQVGARRPIELGGHSWVGNP